MTKNYMEVKMGGTPFIVFFTCLVLSVNCARKSRMEQKFDALDNLVQSKLFLMGEELKTGQLEREVLMEKYNETIATLETQCKTNGKSFTKSGIEQSDLDMLNDKLEELLEKVKDNDKETEKQSEAFLRFKQGIKQEKLARKTNIEAVNERIQKSQNETKQTLNQMQENHLENLNEIKQSLDEIKETQFNMDKNLTEIKENFKELQKNLNEMKEFQTEMKTNFNTVTSNQKQLASQVADLIQDVEQNNAPKLYCNNQLGLDTCLEKTVTQLQDLSEYVIKLHPIIRLVGGSNQYEGRVELYYKGKWGTVCDDFFTKAAAKVACRMLGLSGGTALCLDRDWCQERNTFGYGTGDILLDDVKCSGSEASLFDCPHRGIGEHNCGHSEDVGVRCDP